MKNFAFGLLTYLATALAALAATYRPDVNKPLGFPIYTNKPAGKQITSNQLPATTPALAPGESQKQILVPPGFEVRLFASEPEVVNPVAMTWDERGRLWVLELYEYPKGAANGEKGRDRIKILEDTDADGKADKVTVFADGFSLAEGMVLGNGGVYVGAPPNLYHLKDTNGDDRADTREVLLTGFGAEDRHELLNGFAWGPDGWLYMTHGVFTHSKVKNPNDPDDDGVTMNAALARFHPQTKKFEVFADGTSNPWGVDWNERGDAFVSACVIQHLFHMAPGGQYNRQGGTWANPYGYVGDLPSKGLPAIVDWRHYRAAHAGITVYQGDQYPGEWRGLVFLGNIHQSALNCDRLSPVGSTYKAERESKLLGPAGEALLKKSGEKVPKGEEWRFVGPGNFLVSKDPWFRPVSVQTGPDGAMWVMDWYDKYPCYQNAQADPDGVDREHGRIWRVVWTGNEPGKAVPTRPSREMDLRKSSDGQLVQLLEHSNNWQRRQALRLIQERQNVRNGLVLDSKLRDHFLGDAPTSLDALFASARALGANGKRDEKVLSKAVADPAPGMRMWAARFIGEGRNAQYDGRKQLATLAKDSDPAVRAAVAAAVRQFTSGSLTVNSQPGLTTDTRNLQAHFKELLSRPSVEGDLYYPHIVWMAMEPRVAQDPTPFFSIVGANDNSVSAYAVRRIMRRICDLTDSTVRITHLNAAMKWLSGLASKPGLAEAALDGLIDAFKSKGQSPTIPLEPIFARLTSNPKLADKARRLATLLGDTSASRVLVGKINDSKAPVEDRLKGITAARETKDDAAKAELLKLLKAGAGVPAAPADAQRLYTAAIQALSVFPGDEIGYAMTDTWKNFSLSTRRAAADVLVTRSKWSRALMAALDQKVAKPEDISATARRALAKSSDATVVDHANRVLGKYRAPGEDKLKLIAAKRAVVLSGEGDIRAGYEVAKRACFVCHKLYGEGADVGPDLTGVGRSTLDALLHNIIDPNEVVGSGYDTTEVELKDGTSVSGRIVEETPTRLKLVASGPTEHLIARSDIAMEGGKPKIRTSELSLMPEGLEAIPDQEFRDLIWYLLNPPGDNRAWTPALRRELFGDENAGQKKSAGTAPLLDLESVALWNPDWRVNCPPFEGAPAKLSEYAGRRNVLMTHPRDRQTGSAIERTVEVAAGRQATLRFAVAAHEQGDWELRVLADGVVIHRQTVDRRGDRWKVVTVDLSRFDGRTVRLRLENCANDWAFEFGYWSDLRIALSEQSARTN
jgi:putative membrane-bound dehydrogenase-like protein